MNDTAESQLEVRQRVLITSGAWSGEEGVITHEILPNSYYPIRTDGGIQLAWSRSEIDPITPPTKPESSES